MSAERWTPQSWRGRPIQQAPDYPDAAALADVERQLASFPQTPRLTDSDVAVTMAFAAQMNERPLGVPAERIFTNEYVDLAEHAK